MTRYNMEFGATFSEGFFLQIIHDSTFTGEYSPGQEGSLIFGYSLLNQVMASPFWFPPSTEVSLTASLGTWVGNNTQRLWPDNKLFHALVPSGSMWIPVPERAGPKTNHLWEIQQMNTSSTAWVYVFNIKIQLFST